MSKTLDVNTFYSNRDISIGSEQYSIVLGFFKKVTETEKTAEEFTVNLFRVAKSTNVNVLELLSTMNDKDSIGVSEVMSYYLNQTRSQSVLLGVSNINTPDPQITRNILD
jgi:hypothetical protein